MKGNFGWIVGGDPAHADQQHIGAHVGELCREALGIESGVGLAKVGLDPTDGFCHPPTFLRKTERAGCKREQQEPPPGRVGGHPLSKSLIDVPDQIFHIFQTNREPHQLRCYTRSFLFRQPNCWCVVEAG